MTDIQLRIVKLEVLAELVIVIQEDWTIEEVYNWIRAKRQQLELKQDEPTDG